MAATKKKSSASKKTSSPAKTKAKSRSSSSSRGSGKRELINTGTDKRYVRRDGTGQFKESDDVSRSLSADRRRKSKTASKPGQGDRGDRKR
jgi:hypothetical protein